MPSLSGVAIPPAMKIAYAEAHDKGHGRNPRRAEVNLDQAKGERFYASR